MNFLINLLYPNTRQFIIQYGSTVNGASSPSDVNVFYKGMSKYECEQIVKSKLKKELPIVSVDVSNEEVVKVPVCENSVATNYVVIYKYPIISSMPTITIDRHYTVSAILFNNRMWQRALRKFNAKEIIGLPIQHSEARTQLINTRLKKYPDIQFQRLCDELWWGDLLRAVCESSDQFNVEVLEILGNELIINNTDNTVFSNGLNYSVGVWMNTLMDLF